MIKPYTNLLRYLKHRAADKKLRRAAWRVMRDKAQSKTVRKVARKVFAAFLGRTMIGWHSGPKPWLKKLTNEFRYGNYCGVGVGVPEGVTAPPIDALDAACQEHDTAYL